MDLQAKSDSELLALSTREPRAFAVLVDRYQTAFLRRACRILHDVDEAEDAVQDAFVRIYVHAPRFAEREGASFQSWAYKILTNVCLTRYERRQKRQARFLPLPREEAVVSPSAEGKLEGRLKFDYLVSLFGALPLLLRRAMTLHYLKGWSYEEVARVEGVTPGAVRSRVHRAKKFLLQKLHERRID
jgi:RNA polymerase sigma-70 factor (ECF subfamily)